MFTTHTPVEAGHDRFSWDLVREVLGEDRTALLRQAGFAAEKSMNMTDLAIHFSRYVNGVAMRHGEVSQGMFPHFPIHAITNGVHAATWIGKWGNIPWTLLHAASITYLVSPRMFPHFPIHAITNGVHAATWASPPFHDLFDRAIPEWRRDNAYMRYAVGIHVGEIRKAHALAKAALLKEVQKRTGVSLDESVMTIGFARRAATYKRADLLFRDPERLKAIARSGRDLFKSSMEERRILMTPREKP